MGLTGELIVALATAAMITACVNTFFHGFYLKYNSNHGRITFDDAYFFLQ
jgi:hypothetical protein